jgi:hypothetical protein
MNKYANKQINKQNEVASKILIRNSETNLRHLLGKWNKRIAI